MAAFLPYLIGIEKAIMIIMVILDVFVLYIINLFKKEA